MRKWVPIVPLVILVVGAASACATRKFVEARVREVNGKVETLSQSVEQTQERVRRNEDSLGGLDQKTRTAQGAADQARQAAGIAQARANEARTWAEAADFKADSLDRASRRLVFSVVLSEDQGQFSFGKAMLPEDAKAKIDELVGELKADPKGVYFEIEGHTDSVGPKSVNERIGLERAEAVQRYLFEQHQIPLHKINVISYGMDKPVASNKTKGGRAQNRRVVIRVLA
jgi:peptidoglycan-associated lipoprotein